MKIVILIRTLPIDMYSFFLFFFTFFFSEKKMNLLNGRKISKGFSSLSHMCSYSLTYYNTPFEYP